MYPPNHCAHCIPYYSNQIRVWWHYLPIRRIASAQRALYTHMANRTEKEFHRNPTRPAAPSLRRKFSA